MMYNLNVWFEEIGRIEFVASSTIWNLSITRSNELTVMTWTSVIASDIVGNASHSTQTQTQQQNICRSLSEKMTNVNIHKNMFPFILNGGHAGNFIIKFSVFKCLFDW